MPPPYPASQTLVQVLQMLPFPLPPSALDFSAPSPAALFLQSHLVLPGAARSPTSPSPPSSPQPWDGDNRREFIHLTIPAQGQSHEWNQRRGAGEFTTEEGKAECLRRAPGPSRVVEFCPFQVLRDKEAPWQGKALISCLFLHPTS